jgi:CHAT domain-containing protein/Tfp pilus assembly protein PilF
MFAVSIGSESLQSFQRFGEIKAMHRNAAVRVTFLSISLTITCFANAQTIRDRVAVEQRVLQLLMAFQKRDVQAVMINWSKGSPQYQKFRESVNSDFAAYTDVQLVNIEFLRWKPEVEAFSVRVKAIKKQHNFRTNESDEKPIVWDLRFVTEAGRWKLWQQTDAMSDLVSRLGSGTKEQRSQLLLSEKDLVSVELLRLINNSTDNQARRLQFSNALKLNDLALEIASLVGEKVQLGQCYRYRGLIFSYQSKTDEALEQYNKAIALFKEAKNRLGEAQILHNIGIVYQMQRKYADALDQYEKSLLIKREIHDRREESKTLNNMALVYELLGQYEKALIQHEASLQIRQELGDRESQTQSLTNLGAFFSSRGKYDQALARFEVGLNLAREIRDRSMAASFLRNIGTIYIKVGKNESALERYKESLKLREEIGDKPNEIQMIGLIGQVYETTGRYAQALQYYLEGFTRARENQNNRGAAQMLGSIGNVYNHTGRYSEAVTQYGRALEAFKEIADQTGEAQTLLNIGTAYRELNRYDAAISKFNESRDVWRKIGSTGGEAQVLNNLGTVYQSKKDYLAALDNFEASLTLKQSIGDKEGEATTLANIGYINNLTGKTNEALSKYQSSLGISEEIGDLFISVRTYRFVGDLYRGQKKWDDAIKGYRKAIELTEFARSESRESSLQSGLLAQNILAYKGLAASLLEINSGQHEAFETIERAKARTLIDLMARGDVKASRTMSEQDKRKDRELSGNILALTVQLNTARVRARSEADRRQIESLKHQLDKARADYDEFRRLLFLAQPQLQVQQARFKPISVAGLAALFVREPKLCIFSYLVTDDNTFLFVITRGKGTRLQADLSIYTLHFDNGQPLTQEELSQRLTEFRLRYTNESGIYRPHARELYKILIGPAERDLMGKSHLVIIPDGILNTLPFQALVDKQDKHLIENHSVSYAPSATALVEMMKLADSRKKAKKGSVPLFAMGRRTFPDQAEYRNRDLPWAELQVQEIAKLFGVTPFIDKEATRVMAMKEMKNARYVHFATHGELNEASPMYSAVVLAKSKNDDGRLYARDIIDMDLQCDLAVLSACETGLGQQVSGEGIVGLAWALFVAGSPSSLVTQWNVRADSTTSLMVKFYEPLRINKRKTTSKAESLRQAQLSLLNSTQYSHPYYWAPFVLIGDWR